MNLEASNCSSAALHSGRLFFAPFLFLLVLFNVELGCYELRHLC